jgi:Toprim-like
MSYFSQVSEAANNVETLQTILSDAYSVSYSGWRNGSHKDHDGLKIKKIRGTWYVTDFSGSTLGDGKSYGVYALCKQGYNLRDAKDVLEKLLFLTNKTESDFVTSTTTYHQAPAPARATGTIIKKSYTSIEYDSWESERGKAVEKYLSKKLSTTDLTYAKKHIKPVAVLNKYGKITYFSPQNFAYTVFEGDTIKIFNPNNPEKKERKTFLQSVRTNDKLNYVFGLSDLPAYCKYIFLVEGEHDCMAHSAEFNKNGWYAVTVGSAGYDIDNQLISNLKTRCEHVFVNYDNDDAGEKAMNRIEREHGLKAIRIGKYVNHKNEYPTHEFTDNFYNKTCNDICDCLTAIGAEALRGIIETDISLLLEVKGTPAASQQPASVGQKSNNIIWERCVERVNAAAKKYLLDREIDIEKELETSDCIVKIAQKHGFVPKLDTQKSIELLEAKEGERLTDVLNRYNKKFEFGYKYIVGTGFGKSYTASHKEGKKIIATPTQNLAQQYQKKYSATAYYQDNKKKENVSDFTAAPYASVHELSEKIKASEYNFIHDESHNFTASASFMKSALHRAASEIPKYKTYTQLTATDLYNFDPRLDLPIIKVIAPYRKPKTVQIIRAKNKYFETAQRIIELVKKGEKAVIFLNDTKDELSKFIACFEGIKGVYTLSSDKKETDVFKGIINNNLLPHDFNIIIATSVIKEGTDIDNVEIFNTYFIGAWHTSEQSQCNGRFREAIAVNAHIVKSDKPIESYNFNLFERAKSIIVCAKKSANECNAAKNEIDVDTHTRERRVRMFLQSDPIMCINDLYEIDWLEVNNMLFNDEKNYEYINDAYQLASLQRYENYTVIESTISDENVPIETTLQVMKKVELDREVRDQMYFNELEKIINHPSPTRYAKEVYRLKLEKPKANASEFTLKLSKSFELHASDAAQILVNSGIKSELKLDQLIARTQLQILEGDKSYMDTNRALPIFIKAIRNSFETGKRYYDGEIREIFTEVLKCDKSINVDRLNLSSKSGNQKIFKILGLFFDVKFGTERIDGKVVRYVKLSICNIEIDSKYLINNDFYVTNSTTSIETTLYNEITCPF